MATPLSIIFETSWQSSVVPSDWKGETITPFYKEKYDRELQASLTSVPGKVK